jgi:hypothetical protein
MPRATPERRSTRATASRAPPGEHSMKVLLNEIRHQPLLWLLAFVPVVFVVE